MTIKLTLLALNIIANVMHINVAVLNETRPPKNKIEASQLRMFKEQVIKDTFYCDLAADGPDAMGYVLNQMILRNRNNEDDVFMAHLLVNTLNQQCPRLANRVGYLKRNCNTYGCPDEVKSFLNNYIQVSDY